MSQEEDREANLFIALIVVDELLRLSTCGFPPPRVCPEYEGAAYFNAAEDANYQQKLRHIFKNHTVLHGGLENCYFRFMEERKRRHQQDLNLRSHRETDIREIRICRLNHSAIVS